MSRLRGTTGTLGAGALITAVGDGAWTTVWVVYMTKIVGLRPGDFALGVTIAGVVAILVVTPGGRLADRCGSRGLLMAIVAADAAAAACFALVRSLWAFIAVALVFIPAEQTAAAVEDTYILALHEDEYRLRALGMQRAARSIGYALGGGAGAICLAVNSHQAYLAVIVLNAVSSLIYAGLLRLLPATAPVARTRESRSWRALADRPYVLVIAIVAVLALCWGMLSTGVPLWITGYTRAPRYLVGLLIGLNAAAIAAGQVWFNARASAVRPAARMVVLAGLALAGSCLWFAAAYHGSGLRATGLLLAGGIFETLGELLFVSALWGLSVALMAPEAPGEYQGLATSATGAAQVVSPAVMVAVVAAHGLGWTLLGGVFLLVAAVILPATRWAVSTRKPHTSKLQTSAHGS